MKWHTKYTAVYNKDFCDVQESIKDEVRHKLSNTASKFPLASVVVIAHKEDTRILSCIWSLVDNICTYPIEFIAINNNSTDQTQEVLSSLEITFYNEFHKTPGAACQCGLNHARGKYFLCIDADTIYPPNYIETHIKALMQPNIVGVYGLWSFLREGNTSKVGLWLYENSRDIYLVIRSIKRPEQVVRGMVFSFHTEIARYSGFRIDATRGEDGAMAISLKNHGKLRLLTTRKSRALTWTNTLKADGSLFDSFKVRFIKALKRWKELFTVKNYN